MTRPTERGLAVGLTLGAVLALVAALLVLPLVLAPRAEAFIYWSGGDAIGRANLDGSGVDRGFIAFEFPPDTWRVGDVAVTANHMYWTNHPGGKIGRANLDGTGVNPRFIRDLPGATWGLAVDAEHLYWTSRSWTTDDGAIGRANLDGTNVDRSFITGTGGPYGVAVTPSHIYWAHDYRTRDKAGIGRADLDGSGVDPSFLTARALDVAVDATHLYWTGFYCPFTVGSCEDSIGRADLDGSGVDPTLISAPSGTRPPEWHIAVDAAHLYWTEAEEGDWTVADEGGSGTVGRANLDGSGAATYFIPEPVYPALGSGPPQGVSVDALTDTKAEGKASAARTQGQTGKRIVVKLKVRAKERLDAKATGKIKVNPTYKLKPKKVKLAAGKTKTLRLKPKKAKATQIATALKRGEKAKAKVTVKLTDAAGNSETEKLRVRLRR